MTTDIQPNRPEPVILDDEPQLVTKNTDFSKVAQQLQTGNWVVIKDEYPTGIRLLSHLKKRIFGTGKRDSFRKYRNLRSDYQKASNRLLVPVEDHKIALPKAPEIGWLERFYTEKNGFYLTLPQIQGLNSSWQWYQKGIQFPVLDHPVYPFYGTYFPTRHDHLILFDKWLTKYQGRKTSAYDIGAGCGVLSFQLCKSGFQQIYASDINPNAVISIQENARNLGVDNLISVKMTDFFENWEHKADLIVFNPPWLPAGEETSGLDLAIYYPEGLFERFFAQAREHLAENGRLVVLFSNLGETTGTQSYHPIDEELDNHQRFRKVRVIKRKVKGGSKKTRRRNNRSLEYVELWELEKR